jgi:type VI secretion system protein VasG
MRVEPKALVRRLNPTCTKALEGAVERAATMRSYEIVVEHMLASLLENGESDVAQILSALRLDRSRVAAEVSRGLQRIRSGNSGRPVFSETLFAWMENAWLTASVNDGSTLIRSGDLFVEYVEHPTRYSPEPSPTLENLATDEVRKIYPSKVQAEAIESQPSSGESAGAAGAKASAAGREAIDRFCVSFTDKARNGEIDQIFGRDQEIRQVIDILARRRKNNPLIVGEPGVGKTALIEGLALAIIAGEVPKLLQNTELVGLDLGLLQAGAGVRGELENRLKRVIAEIKGSPTPIILFIDEAHMLLGSGGKDGADLANLLKPALARGELRTVAATTWAEYKKYFEKDAALERRFQPVKVDEPSVDQAIVMLRGVRAIYETAHAVTVRDDAVIAAVELSSRYISGRQLPDKAVDLLDTAAARVRIEQAAPPMDLVDVRSQIAALNRQIEAQSRDLEDGADVDAEALSAAKTKIESLSKRGEDIEKRWHRERELLEAVITAEQALRKADADTRAAALEALQSARTALGAVQGERPLVHAQVDRDAVARVVADWTGIPVGKMQSSAISNLLSVDARLAERIRGQDTAISTVSESIRMAHAGVRDPRTPIAVLLFVGPSGVGKTETVLTLADTLYGGESAVTTINMSEFQEKHSVSRLIGSPPGYVGYGEGGVLTEAVRQKPYSVVLLDECEKADLEVMNLFYQVFDKGELSDSEGRVIDFKNTVIVLTSNLATDMITKMHASGAHPSNEDLVTAIRPILSKHFKPALLGRMTIVPFRPVRGEVLQEIVALKVRKLASRLELAHGVPVQFAPEILTEMSNRCSESEAGARAIDGMLRSSLMPFLAREILSRLTEGPIEGAIRVGLGGDAGWTVEFAEKSR